MAVAAAKKQRVEIDERAIEDAADDTDRVTEGGSHDRVRVEVASAVHVPVHKMVDKR